MCTWYVCVCVRVRVCVYVCVCVCDHSLLAFLAFFGGGNTLSSPPLYSFSEPSISSCLMAHSSFVPVHRITVKTSLL